MKRFLTIFFVLAFATNAFAGEFGWTLSNSPSDPLSNQGTFTAGILTLYLHYYCTNNARGLASAEFDVASSNPANLILAFTATNPPFLNAGGATNLLLAVGGCPSGPALAGSFLISANAAGQYCLTTSAIGNNVSVNCVDLNTYDNDWIGYSNDGNPPCASLEDLCTVAVENTSWGSVKSLYR